jgi:hypothetical protein
LNLREREVKQHNDEVNDNYPFISLYFKVKITKNEISREYIANEERKYTQHFVRIIKKSREGGEGRRGSFKTEA